MPPETTVRAGEAPAPRLCDPPPARRAGRGRPPLVHLDHADARQGRLVLQGADQMRAPPLAQPEVLSPPYVLVADPLGVADPQGSDFVVDRPGDHGPGSLVLCLMDAPAVAGLRSALGSAELSPSPRSP